MDESKSFCFAVGPHKAVWILWYFQEPLVSSKRPIAMRIGQCFILNVFPMVVCGTKPLLTSMARIAQVPFDLNRDHRACHVRMKAFDFNCGTMRRRRREDGSIGKD